MLTRKQLLARIAKEKHLGTFKGFEMQKQFAIKAIAGVEVTPDILATINQFAIEPLTAEQVYVRKFLLAHNCVDRDRERFPEVLLDDFARTLSGKSVLKFHDRQSLPIGLFFQAITEEMTPEQFKTLTGEEPRLAEGGSMVKVLWAWMYTLSNEYNAETILNINAGIYRHVSIGFRASDLIAVKGQYDQILYWEYVAPGEALEGSIVWLGAQPGATAQKGAGESEEEIHINEETEQGGRTMKGLFKVLSKLFPGRNFTEEGIADEVKDAIEEYMKKAKQALDDAVAPLKAKIAELEPLVAKAKELEPLAAEGKAYRADLCDQYAKAKQKLGDIEPETLVKTKEIAGTFGIDFLKAELVVLGKRVEEKFPDTGELTAGDPEKNREKGGEKENPLIPKEVACQL